MSKDPKPKPYSFHPLELSILGFSGLGKTTLIASLLSHLKSTWEIGYVKHDAHAFEVDKPGKDSFRASEAGARGSFIANDKHFAWMGRGALSYFNQRSVFLDYEAVIIEGHKTLDIDKLVMLDADHAILEQLPASTLARIRAFVGEASHPLKPLPLDRPYFQRNSIPAIAALIEGIWQEKITQRPLHALVLAGGRSSRMGQDKSRIVYQGQPQSLRVLELMGELGLPAFLSLREDQWREEHRGDLPILFDQFRNLGPIGGILTAMQAYPEAAWLVIACDLPYLRRPVLEHILEKRRPSKMATAFRSSLDGLPEPLCAIYEPSIRMRLFEALGLGFSCPRKVLLNSNSLLLDPYDDIALTNVNTPDEYHRVHLHLSEMSP